MEKTNSIVSVLAITLITAYLKSTDGYSYHAYCAARPTVVRIDKSQNRYFPFFVTLNRCDGSCSTDPSNQRCEAISDDEVKIKVHDMSKDESVELIMKNHTRCICKCVLSMESCRLELETWNQDNCRCECRYPNGPPKDLACKPDFIWNRYTCRCQCNKAPEICPPGKVWNVKSCACVCSTRVIKRCERKEKGLDYEKCKCVDVQALQRYPQENSKSRMFITLLVGQGFLLVVILCVLVHFVRKSKRTSSNDHEDAQPSPQISPNPLPSRSESGHISCSSHSTAEALASTDKPKYKSSNGSVQIQTNGEVITRESTI